MVMDVMGDDGLMIEDDVCDGGKKREREREGGSEKDVGSVRLSLFAQSG